MSVLSQLSTGLVLCEDAFSQEELIDIQTVCSELLKTHGDVTNMTGDPALRKSEYMFIPRVASTKAFYTHLAQIGREINSKFYNFDLTGYTDDGILYLEYNQPGDHFDWHIDNSENYRSDKDPVKLIVVLQLTDPKEYEGADAEVAGTGITTIPKKQGLVYAMPGYTSHRVTPLVSGRRAILSCWFTGPKFK